jgi:glutathione peroxidase
MTTTDFHTLSARRADGTEMPMAAFRDQVLLVVNVASKCGFTPQYAGLEALQQRFAPRGFTVLAFPCNQFGAQEPGDEASIVQFCTTRFHATFPIFAKVDVNGPEAHPIYRQLTAARPGLLGTRRIKWNFTKFLLDRQGEAVRRYGPTTKPAAIAGAIERLL